MNVEKKIERLERAVNRSGERGGWTPEEIIEIVYAIRAGDRERLKLLKPDFSDSFIEQLIPVPHQHRR